MFSLVPADQSKVGMYVVKYNLNGKEFYTNDFWDGNAWLYAGIFLKIRIVEVVGFCKMDAKYNDIKKGILELNEKKNQNENDDFQLIEKYLEK